MTSFKHIATDLTHLIFGSRAVIESILAGQPIEKVFLQSSKWQTPLTKELYTLIRQHAIPYTYLPVAKFKQWINKNHQGVVAIRSPIVFSVVEHVVQASYEKGELPLLVVLDGVSDVHNVGAIARTAACMGVHALVLPTQGSASITAVAMKTSAGALATLPVCRTANLSHTLAYLQAAGLTIIACHEKAAQPLCQVDLTSPVALILGDEAMGIAAKHLTHALHQVSIPIQGPIASLNVSVAAGMLLYEVLRQRNR
ncbi:23S rRNA (guanosine(2251)-2'-O)-methyltransferase RlmB [Candidatus Cardinium hertigii]|uniref:TrmH family tRNA/rRNA methyltransferase n=1 Tax=Candidatus Cardinium hertigii TaxID=247481 RepID=A0A2Z3LG02_9BACT|nr:23S rRNA (guanosine(2251)-2'-O)-methyltransferase RlmB [Candidatus Cardinium hertigii]AWN81495.1 Putative TrmH family tRNA/rRNA methyltransferase [Candidatus Cardinium hertigii]